MISFPQAKINLGLHVLNKRDDGYHEIESCLFPIDLYETLEIIESDNFSFQSSGLKIAGNPASNLVLKAYHLLKSAFNLPPVSIYLHKVIPMGAGLGGGSSDGAFALKMLNELFELRLENNQLCEYASQLGSDCPFFIGNSPAIVTGTGTELRTINLDLSTYRIELQYAGVHVSTSEAYGLVIPRENQISLEEIIGLPVEEWQEVLKNDFEEAILSRYTKIQQAKDELIQKGAIYAAMTGTGSCVFGLFNTK